jgi:hypothetical protein
VWAYYGRPRQGDYADRYGDEQPLPKAPRKQLIKQILAELDSAALDAIQGEADAMAFSIMGASGRVMLCS